MQKPGSLLKKQGSIWGSPRFKRRLHLNDFAKVYIAPEVFHKVIVDAKGASMVVRSIDRVFPPYVL